VLLVLPEATVLPFTVTLAYDSVEVGVTLTEVVELPTSAEYARVPGAKVGLTGPESNTSPESVETVDNLVTVMV
jgi:hypothetical protein